MASRSGSDDETHRLGTLTDMEPVWRPPADGVLTVDAIAASPPSVAADDAAYRRNEKKNRPSAFHSQSNARPNATEAEAAAAAAAASSTSACN